VSIDPGTIVEKLGIVASIVASLGTLFGLKKKK